MGLFFTILISVIAVFGIFMLVRGKVLEAKGKGCSGCNGCNKNNCTGCDFKEPGK